MSQTPMNKEKLDQCVGEVTRVVTELCDNPGEVLTVLLHVTATALWFIVGRMKSREEAEKYVVGYCMQITKLIDANLKANSK